MNTEPDARFDAIVIGSGIGGLACACGLTHSGYKVLVLERHSIAGGLTQTFSRNGFTWDVGVHYLGMGSGGRPRAVLDWLSEEQIDMASVGRVYDTFRFPSGFEIQVPQSEDALKREISWFRSRDPRLLLRHCRGGANGRDAICAARNAYAPGKVLRTLAPDQHAQMVG